ncbi:MAG: chromosome segregation protein SMC [Stomatobaculum sp.]|nr:chromosome segregation protein SMC [Stomatobaculum sp.]
MYLKSIEVQGFKSFANKIRFEFQDGITGIVGPNGSGKSNVSDAVRWVLGEQSAKSLRGGNMQDVIFAGTELRKPQGFAYVAITLDNSDRALHIDYDEVKVSRRLYRSGESEYKINDSACRLKDINELFFDTGIGQEGYSIIGQGEVERILSGKAEERRELFDEAAGITKFRKRKALAEKKLDNERADLVRVSDILSELEKQVGPLKRQSETARKYLELREELKSLELNLFLMETDAVRTDLKSFTEREQILSQDAEETEKNEEQLKSEYEELEQILEELDREIEEKRNSLSELNLNTNELTGRINVLQEKINTEKRNAKHINNRLGLIAQDKQEKDAALEGFISEKTESDAAAAEAKKKAEEAEWILVSCDEEMMLLDQKIQDLKNSVIDIINERGDITAKGQRFEAVLEQVQVRASELNQKLLKIRTEEESLKKDVGAGEREMQELDKTQASLEESRSAVLRRKEECTKEVNRLGLLLGNLQQQYQADSVRLESLRNLAERYDGYGNSIRKVMETRDRIRGIHGVVADLISVDKKYETAIETALGGKIQNIVTDSEETAKRLIEHLKRNRFGRATFLPLTSIGRGKEWDPGEVMKEQGVLGIASGLVHTEETYEGLVRYLLGRDLVVTDIDQAIRIARKYHYSFRIVTLEGELLNPGGSMSGGAFKNSSNLLGRKREIEELEKATEKSLKKAELAEKELAAAQELLEKAGREIEELRAEEQELLLEKNTKKMALGRLLEKREELNASVQELTDERGRLKQQTSEISDSRQELDTDLKDLEERRAGMETEIVSLSEKLEEERKRREALDKDLSDAKLLAGTTLQQAGFINENIRRLKDELKKLCEEEKELLGGTEDTGKRIAEREEEIKNAEQEILSRKEKAEVLTKELEEQTAKKAEHSGEQKQYFERRNEIAKRRADLEKDLLRVRNQIEKAEDKLQTKSAYILSEYNLTEEGALQYRMEKPGSASQMKKDIDSRKTAIRELGNVNVNAIEDYRVLSERCEFMSGQYSDMKKAEEALLTVIRDLDQGMRKQFTEQFEKIDNEFNKVFRALFGGGRGELRLDPDADILDASIAIIAEPPGKKLQNMMQLSGGEKALTAISLLFAIQNLRPSPFALLDEIEAALDDSNVDRFVQYLRRLTKNTQFIVITHRRGTMVGADRLYGITMQEKGISTLVSVSLIEDSLD